VAKKPCFAPCQEYILDRKAAGTRFDQCLQGFRVLKIVVIMTCTKSAIYAIMGERKAEGQSKGRIMKAELRNRDRYPSGVVKSTQLRFIRLTNQAPSQCVAASHSDYLQKSVKANKTDWWSGLTVEVLFICPIPSHASHPVSHFDG
jgi:hypothetical protein